MADPILPPENVNAKPIPGYQDYMATDDGRVWSCKSGRWLKLNFDRGYARVSPWCNDGQPVHVHKLVALAFHGPSTLPMVRHLNGVKTDNRPCNLAYGTNRDNIDDEIRLGSFEKGADGPHTRITSATARLIVELHAAGVSSRKIAKITGVPRSTAQDVFRGETWPHLKRCPFALPKFPPRPRRA